MVDRNNRFTEDNGEPTFPPDTGMENQLNISHKDGYNKIFAEVRSNTIYYHSPLTQFRDEKFMATS